MRYSNLDGINKPVARLVQGTVMLTAEDRDGNFRLLDALFENGYTTFDTAHGYGAGVCEKELGAWINARGLRDQIVILTKGAHPYEGEPDRVAPEYIRRDLEESLQRLRTDHIEIYMLHRDSPHRPVDEIVDVLDEFRSQGLIGVYGGSNWRADRVKAANDYAAANGRAPFTVSSPQFSVAEMIKESWPGCISVSGEDGEADRAWYDENEIALFTWSSLAGGFLTGAFRRGNLDSFTDYYAVNSIGAYAYESNFRRLDRVLALAEDKGVTPAQIALAYVLSNNQRYHAIIANWKVDEIAVNAAAADIKLSDAEIAWLEMKLEEKPA